MGNEREKLMTELREIDIKITELNIDKLAIRVKILKIKEERNPDSEG